VLEQLEVTVAPDESLQVATHVPAEAQAEVASMGEMADDVKVKH
jgi:hypothetical protein